MDDAAQVAHASIDIRAPRARVWDALTDPAAIRQYMFGATVASNWQVGSAITWTGEWQGRPYQDRGEILRLDRERVLEYSHYSPRSGLPDVPESYHHVRIELAGEGPATRVMLAQDGNATREAREHSEANWRTMLDGLKRLLEVGERRAP